MIDKREILEAASALKLLPSIVEKDYVLGWVSCWHQRPSRNVGELGVQGWHLSEEVLLRTYRFSEDLDFTLRDEGHVDEGLLRQVLADVVAWVGEQSGLDHPCRPARVRYLPEPA